MYSNVIEGLAPLKAEAAVFDELSAAVLHLQREMDNMRQVKPLGILARIKQESGDLGMVDVTVYMMQSPCLLRRTALIVLWIFLRLRVKELKWKALFNWFMIGFSRDILLGGTACHSGDSLLCTGKSSTENILSLSRSFAKN